MLEKKYEVINQRFTKRRTQHYFYRTEKMGSDGRERPKDFWPIEPKSYYN